MEGAELVQSCVCLRVCFQLQVDEKKISTEELIKQVETPMGRWFSHVTGGTTQKPWVKRVKETR